MQIFISENIKFYRAYQRVSQKELAASLGITIAMVKSYERVGNVTPSIIALIKIATMLNVSLDALIKIELTNDNYLLLKKEFIADKKNISAIEKLEKRVSALEKMAK
jgi:transcriptional regulator with XRE-family HTH domain